MGATETNLESLELEELGLWIEKLQLTLNIQRKKMPGR